MVKKYNFQKFLDSADVTSGKIPEIILDFCKHRRKMYSEITEFPMIPEGYDITSEFSEEVILCHRPDSHFYFIFHPSPLTAAA